MGHIRPHIAALCGLGVPDDRLAGWSAALKLPLWHLAAGAAETAPAATRSVLDGPVLALVGSPQAAEPAEVWETPFSAWIEPSSLSDRELSRAATRADDADLFAFLTTATSNHLHLAGRIVAVIAARRPLDSARRDDLELALHEAISNAVVHGNLQVEGMKGLSMEALERFSHDLAARMADPAFATRRVEVGVWMEDHAVVVEVADEGTGFARRDPTDHGASGRGLELIGAIAGELELLDGGRRIRMRFPL